VNLTSVSARSGIPALLEALASEAKLDQGLSNDPNLITVEDTGDFLGFKGFDGSQ